MSSWSDKRIVQLLLHVIDEKVQGPPNYERLGQVMGVTKKAVEHKYYSLRKEFRETTNQDGNATPRTTPKKRPLTTTMNNVKELEGGVNDESAVKAEVKLESPKRAKSSRTAAGKAKERIKEEYEKMANFSMFEDE